MSEQEPRFDAKLNKEKVLRTAAVRAESGNYVYSFDPVLSTDELRQNPEYERIVQGSLAIGGFKAKVATTHSGEGDTSLELHVSSYAPREYVANLFDTLRSAGIADIQTGVQEYRSSVESDLPKTPEEHAIISLFKEKFKVGGGVIHATVDVDSNDEVKRVGYSLKKDGVEIAFAPVDRPLEHPVQLTISLTSMLNEYLRRLSRTN